jgi:hypothetical protein
MTELRRKTARSASSVHICDLNTVISDRVASIGVENEGLSHRLPTAGCELRAAGLRGCEYWGMSLGTIADDLYGLTPEQFTAARNERAAGVRVDDAALARDILSLRKPTPAAWLANALVRHCRGQLDDALKLGEKLRTAGDDRHELTALLRERRAVVIALTVKAGALATELERPVSMSVLEELSRTIQAAITDDGAAEAVLGGRLLRSLAAVGFDPVDLTDAVALPGGTLARVTRLTPRLSDDPAERGRLDELAKARGAVDAAERAIRAAQASVRDINEQIASTDRRRDDLEIELARAEDTVRSLKADVAAIDRAGRALDRERDKAVRSLDAAQDAAARADKGLERLIP